MRIEEAKLSCLSIRILQSTIRNRDVRYRKALLTRTPIVTIAYPSSCSSRIPGTGGIMLRLL
jgi:hypothetical protein